MIRKRRLDQNRITTDRLDRPLRGVDLRAEAKLVVRIAALPGEECPAGLEERQRELDEIGEAGHGPGGGDRPLPAMARVAGNGFRSLGNHPPRFSLGDGPADDAPCRLEEPRLLPDRFHENEVLERQCEPERDRRIAAATAKVDEAFDLERVQPAESGQAVRNVADRDGGRVADRRQVDRGVPGEQEPDVVVDRAADVVRQPQPERRQGGIEGVVVRGGKLRKGVDARRERVQRTVQAPS